jgi:hypothetical protein
MPFVCSVEAVGLREGFGQGVRAEHHGGASDGGAFVMQRGSHRRSAVASAKAPA